MRVSARDGIPLWLLAAASMLPLLVCIRVEAALPPNHPHYRRGIELERSSSSRNLHQQRSSIDYNAKSTSQALREHLLTNYDKNVFPFTHFWKEQLEVHNATLRTGVPIQVGLNFHRIFEVDVMRSVSDMIVWVRQSWVDPRLRWDPEDWDGIRSIQLWVGGGSGHADSNSEIWTPDLQLWNLEAPLSETLADAHAAVSADGSVFWSRPGHVKPVCKFKGLDDFPFETLQCTMEIGSWAYSGLYLRPIKMGDGFSIGGSETAGEAFQEFSLEAVECEEHVYPPYPTDPESDWPVLLYHVFFQRSWQPYVRGYLLLQIVLNVVAFSSFWLPPHIGERMGLAITAMLAAVASELVVAETVPAANELTWFAKFSLVSLLFASAALLESAAVIYFHYHTGDDLVPQWAHKLGAWLKGIVSPKKKPTGRGIRGLDLSALDASSETSAQEADTFMPTSHSPATRQPPQESPPNAKSSVRKSVGFSDTVVSTVIEDDSSREAGEWDSTNSLEDDEDLFSQPPTSQELAALEETAGNTQLNSSTTMSNSIVARPRDGRPGLNSMDPSMATSVRTRKSIKTILGRDADDFKNAKEMENNLRWQKVAHSIDDASRVLFPVGFCMALAAVLAKAENL